MPKQVHDEFHAMLRTRLRDKGIPLNVGGRGGSTDDWMEYFQRNSDKRIDAYDAVLEVSREIDQKYGTTATRDTMYNFLVENFHQ